MNTIKNFYSWHLVDFLFITFFFFLTTDLYKPLPVGILSTSDISPRSLGLHYVMKDSYIFIYRQYRLTEN